MNAACSYLKRFQSRRKQTHFGEFPSTPENSSQPPKPIFIKWERSQEEVTLKSRFMGHFRELQS